jgi:hypothetical protein
MKISIVRNADVESLRLTLTEFDRDPTVESILILACDANGYTPEGLNPILQSLSKPCFGGVFPQVLGGKVRLTQGAVLVGMNRRVETSVIQGLSDPSTDFEGVLKDAFAGSDADYSTMFVFVDGLSTSIGGLIEVLFNQFGLEINYIGGGAGSISLRKQPCIFTNLGLLQDSAVLALTELPSSIGVAHGWRSISDAFKVTEAIGNRIITLDWRPAFEVYREVVEQHSGLSFEVLPFLDIAKAYPFGIAKLDAEMVVRDPMQEQQGELVCIGEVPKGAFVHILYGRADTVIEAAGHALNLARLDFSQGKPGFMLFVDCISRVLFLGEEFNQEINAVASDELPMVGALTLGEIANNGHDYLEFYNKTSVIGLFPE